MPEIAESRESLQEIISLKLFYILLAVASCYLFLFYSGADIRRVVGLVPDDAFYFFKIAENVAAGNGFTFDGINKTNGFQPLWLYVLVPVSYMYHGTPEFMARVYLILQIILLASSALILYSVHSEIFPKSVRLVSSIFFIFLVFLPSARGMETALLILMISILFVYGWRRKVFSQHNPGRELLFGIILGLVILSRLDMVFLAVSIYGYCFYNIVKNSPGRQENIKRFLMISAGFLIIICPYLLYNYFYFGSIMPISGALKTSFPHVSLATHIVFQGMGIRHWVGVISALTYLSWFFMRPEKLYESSYSLQYFKVSMVILSASVILHFLHTTLFMKWSVYNWHFDPYLLFLSLAVSEPVFYFLSLNLKRSYKMTLYWLCVTVLIITGSFVAYVIYTQPLNKRWNIPQYDAAVWARERTEEIERFGLTDAGTFGYFSQRSVVNLDGVVNNLELQDAIKNHQLNDYLKKKKVQYIVNHSFRDRDIINGSYEIYSNRYKSHKYMVSSDEILLKKTDEVYRSQPYPYYGENQKTVLIIWKLSCY